MKKIHGLAEISPLPDGELLIRYNGLIAYVLSYDEDGFCFHSNPFLSEWFNTIEECKEAAIDYLFSSTDPLTLLQDYIGRSISSPWVFKHSGGRLTIITPSKSVAVVDMSLKVIHATDDDIQCSTYGWIESIKPYIKHSL